MKSFSSTNQAKAGDRAIDGLLAGMAAGTAMLAFLILVGWMFSEPAASIMARFSAGEGWLQGALLHLAVSGVYGVAFGVGGHLTGRLWSWLDSPLTAMLAGLIYGSFLWMISGMVLLAVDVSPFETLPQPTFAIAHLIYGVTLGALVERQGSRRG